MVKRWDVLIWLIDTYKLNVGVEVGVMQGRNIDRILRSRTHFKFYGVDPWVLTSEYAHWNKKMISKHEAEAKTVDEKYGRRCELIKAFSVEGAKQFDPSSIDLVFIDGAHTYDAVRQDIDAWLPKLKPGGIISGHDYRNRTVYQRKGHDFSGVEKAVDERFGPQVQQAEDHVWWVRV